MKSDVANGRHAVLMTNPEIMPSQNSASVICFQTASIMGC